MKRKQIEKETLTIARNKSLTMGERAKKSTNTLSVTEKSEIIGRELWDVQQ